MYIYIHTYYTNTNMFHSKEEINISKINVNGLKIEGFLAWRRTREKRFFHFFFHKTRGNTTREKKKRVHFDVYRTLI